jgi:hypothetical protein
MCGKEEKCIGCRFCGESLKEGGHLEGRMTLRSSKWSKRAWGGFVWLMIGTNGRLLLTQ